MSRLEHNNGFAQSGAGLHYGQATSAQFTAPDRAGAEQAPQMTNPVPFNGLLTNKLLTALPGADFARLLPQLEPVSLACGNDLYDGCDPVQDVYFPETAVLSHLYVLTDGSTTEAALIGKDGVAGLSAIFNAPAPAHWTQVIVAGSALRMSAALLRREFARGGAMQRLLLAYTSARLEQLAQRAVCNNRHTVEERLCSWLLLIHDRTGGERLPLTHEQIARHLGARRAGITEAVNAFRARQLLNHSRGQIHITDRPGLEEAACECYRTLSQRTLTAAQL